MDNTDIIYTEDVIRMLGGKVTSNFVYALVREKKIKAFKAGKRWIFSRSKVQEFIDKKLGLC